MSYGQPRNPMDDLELKIKKMLSNPKQLLPLVLIFILIPVVSSSFYTVQPDEEAVVLRFGKYTETTTPGLHFKLPFGIDTAIKVKTKLVLQEEFGFRTTSTGGKRTSYSNSSFDGESLMLTGDLNVADVEWITQFQIAEPQKFLFNTRDPVQNIRDISEAVMRRVVGDRLVTDVLTVGRTEIANEAKQLTQEILNNYDMGVRVISIKLQDVNPPEPVKPSFNEVNAAKQEQEQAINQAEKHYNDVIPEARGQAEKKIAEAEGYAQALVNTAEGDAKKFSAVLKEYKKAPKITRERMYIETMEKVLRRMDDITVVDQQVSGLLPIYNSTKDVSGGKNAK
ncbi:MAG: FtsH protease activity modulator HflK [Halobacteriovorax sp.]|nr:FtsH protease activity modulator HflK [Halobacteriovorax sp.]